MPRRFLCMVGSIVLAQILFVGPVLAMETCPVRQVVPVSAQTTHYLNRIGSSPEDQSRYYHLSGGTQLLPYEWLLALPRSHGPGFFLDPDHLTSLRLLPDRPNATHNPDQLPVGFAKTTYPQDPRQIREYAGVTCAFCHTTHLTYKTPDSREHHLYIEGASSFQDNFVFMKGLLESLQRTAADDAAFDCFASQVLKTQDGQEARAALRIGVRRAAEGLRSRARPDVATWGLGRIDALGRAGNSLYSNLDHDNYRYVNAPVSIPPLWNIQHYDWVQWSGSIQNPLARNIAQIIGIGAGLFESPTNLAQPGKEFTSSLDLKGLAELESLTETIRPPAWPEAVFGAIDVKSATLGKALYKDRCKHCHVPEPLEHPTSFGQRFRMTMVYLEEVGTDSTYLKNFASRTIGTGPLSAYFGTERIAMGTATQRVTSTLMEAAGRYEPNTWIAWPGFMARPHAGLWATPPFLHNGSVPNLYQLLSPKEDRDDCFLLGDISFDPVLIGFTRHTCSETARLTQQPPDSRFDTSLVGNSNQGHEFRQTVRLTKPDGQVDSATLHELTADECHLLEGKGHEGWSELKRRGYDMTGVIGCSLSHQERLQIIEYLKTCDLDEIAWPEAPQPKVCRSFVAQSRD
ncbi:MAG: hypothetical protein KF814_09205 [Nitrospiraceae bacterium]|nr:hypothetical protein [Nitrospiraceae bacterium]